jgi:hypothetical protein
VEGTDLYDMEKKGCQCSHAINEPFLVVEASLYYHITFLHDTIDHGQDMSSGGLSGGNRFI